MRNRGNEWIRRRKPFIIAEFGSNIFPYSREKLVGYCQVASQAGADAVKVQLYFAEHFPSDEQGAKQATVFPRADVNFFAIVARRLGLAWGASVFDRDAVNILAAMGADFLKLATREEHNIKLRAYANRKFKGTILRSVQWPASIQGSLVGYPRFRREVTLACVPDYPTSVERALGLLGNPAELLLGPWGWSSHTTSGWDCVTAAGLGASVVEKHLRLSPDDLENDWSVSGEHLGAIVESCKGAGG